MVVDECLTGRDPRGQGSINRGDHLGGLGAWPRAPSLSIAWHGRDRTRLEARRLSAFCKTGECLLGIGFTGKRGPAQLLARFACPVAVLEHLCVDRALRLGLAMLRVDQDPALRHTTVP